MSDIAPIKKKVEYSEQDRKRIRTVTWLSVIPGGGQFYNKQALKGVIFLGIFALMIIEMALFGWGAMEGLITLGTTPREDHSLFLLIEGVLQLLILVVFAVFYIAQIYYANKVAKISALNPANVNQTAGEILNNVFEGGFAYLLTIPAYLIMLFTIIFPVVVTLFLAFTNYNFYNIPPANLIDWTGLDTFSSIFQLSSYRSTFFSVLSWTVIWTISATTLQLVIGVFTAMVMNQPFIKFRRVFGVILLLPWAVPAFITILTFSNMFNPSVGAVNTQVIPFLNNIIPFLDIPALAWKTSPFWTKIAIIMIQGWLGYPYIYVLVTGILQSIPGEWYEAASIDGASGLQKFRYITMPHIFAVAAPIFVTQYTGNFNNFNMIYLFNEGGPGSVGSGAGSTDILISWIYKLTTGQSPQYNVASAVTIIISIVVITISMIIFSRSRAFQMED